MRVLLLSNKTKNIFLSKFSFVIIELLRRIEIINLMMQKRQESYSTLSFGGIYEKDCWVSGCYCEYFFVGGV